MNNSNDSLSVRLHVYRLEERIGYCFIIIIIIISRFV